ncbi:MAG: hypothetical protein ACTSQ8_07885 [Candidatus Helarchaeota archaeon]
MSLRGRDFKKEKIDYEEMLEEAHAWVDVHGGRTWIRDKPRKRSRKEKKKLKESHYKYNAMNSSIKAAGFYKSDKSLKGKEKYAIATAVADKQSNDWKRSIEKNPTTPKITNEQLTKNVKAIHDKYEKLRGFKEYAKEMKEKKQKQESSKPKTKTTKQKTLGETNKAFKPLEKAQDKISKGNPSKVSASGGRIIHVSGYYRKDGTYVKGYDRHVKVTKIK